MNLRDVLTILLVAVGSCLSYAQKTSQYIYMEQGQLTYAPFAMTGQTNAVNTIPDFSYAGYMGGGVPLPDNIATKSVVSPEEGDDAARIQAAIDYVESLDPDQNGFRGVVLLEAGSYSLDNVLAIRSSGVVLRGEGQGLNGTVLHANPRIDHNVITILGSGDISIDADSEESITDAYVPVGSYSFAIEDATDFAVGDNIVVTRKPNQVWIDQLGMDQETLCEGKSGCTGWTTDGYQIDHERTITGVSGNTISINIPIIDVIEAVYGGGSVSKVVSSKRISKCGVENMRIQSFYDADADESHAWTAVRLLDVENCWVQKVTGQYLAYSTVNIESGNFVTVQDCAYLDPKSKVTGGRRYSFAIQEGMGNLFQRCYAVGGRHDFVTGSRVTGPNVFLDGLAENARSDIGPHHRWATGTLFDNVRGGSIRVWNRGNAGTGHGWSGAQTMFWNMESYGGEFRVDSPHGSINWSIGSTGTSQTGEGYWESWDCHVEPRSVYLQQLSDRLGQGALHNITIPEQRTGDIYGLLDDWSGRGDFSDGGFSGDIPTVSFVKPEDTIYVSQYDGSDIQLTATDSDGSIKSVRLLINGEPVAKDSAAPYDFSGLASTVAALSHQVHYLQAIATDNEGNTNMARMPIIGGDPPPMEEDDIEEEEGVEARIFPNPSMGGAFTISMKEAGIYAVGIFDLYGRKLDSFVFEGQESLYKVENPIAGVHVVEIRKAGIVIFKRRLIIQ